ncbi:MAG: outer membrane lipoprotein chaperone LolA [Chlorobi bacterium]|nr:outer membrane lipoprotein chaperone LolA [Chlorobiota bacterium]
MKKLINVIFVILLAGIINAQTADEVVQEIQTKFSTINDLKANFIQTIYSSEKKKPTILTGKFYFKKDNSLRIEVKDRLIVSNGVTVWNFNKSTNKVIISKYDNDYTNFSLPEIINSYPDMCDKEIVERKPGVTEIKLTPKDDRLNFKSVLISVDKNDVITKVEITDFNNMKFVFELDSVQLNNKLSGQLFNFEPSEGVEVIDLR